MTLEIIKNNDITLAPFINLQQLYEHEFATITGYKTGDNGLYSQKEIMSHWHEKFDVYILYQDKRPIGFSVINLKSMINSNVNTRDMAEFFIVPDSRKHGLGKWFAQEIFKKYPGKWQVRQFPGLKAREFWTKVISEFTQGYFKDTEMKNELY